MFLLINTTISDSSHYTESDAKIFTNFSKLAACASKPLNKNCPKCVNPGNGYKFYFFYQTTRINKFNYKFMIHYNDILKKILVTFSGPSVSEHVYIKYIYSAGFSLVKKYNFQVEKEYYQIYFNKLRKILKQKLMKVRSSGRTKFQTYFAGHSIGGSLATLAAFDMQQSKVIKDIKVFSLAPLRLGDATYVAMVNSYVTVYRIVKKSDYLVRIPNCYYSTTYKMWRCFNEKIVKEFILKPSFPLKIYVNSYLTYYRRTNTILRAAIVYARKRISHKKVHLVKKHRKGKKAISKRKSTSKTHKKSKSGKKKSLRNHNIKTLKHKANKLKKKSFSIQKVLKVLHHKMNHSKISLKKFNPKKIQKASKKITTQLKKLKNKKVDKKSTKKIKNLIKKARKMNSRKLKKKPSLLKRKMKRFFRNVKHLGKRVSRKAHSLFKKGMFATRKVMRKTHKKVHKPKKSKKMRKAKKAKNPKKVKDTERSSAKNNKKKLYPIKTFEKKKKTKNIVTKTYTYIPSKFKVYSPLQTYFNFVYYTQPIGYQIFYNDLMTTFTTCQYVNGISLCEKVVSLPLQFSIAGHMTYFDIDFNKC